MTIQRLALVLTVVNLLLLLSVAPHLGSANADQVAPVLRGRSLEIVDDRGKLRAQVIVAPASTVSGKTYPETVLLRLIDPNGRPAVKIGASVDGSGIGLAGDSERREWSGIQLLAEGTGSVIKLVNRDGKEQLLKP